MFHLQTNPSLIEVVKGYGVKCTQRQLDEVEANSSGSPTKNDKAVYGYLLHRRGTGAIQLLR